MKQGGSRTDGAGRSRREKLTAKKRKKTTMINQFSNINQTKTPFFELDFFIPPPPPDFFFFLFFSILPFFIPFHSIPKSKSKSESESEKFGHSIETKLAEVKGGRGRKGGGGWIGIGVCRKTCLGGWVGWEGEGRRGKGRGWWWWWWWWGLWR